MQSFMGNVRKMETTNVVVTTQHPYRKLLVNKA